MPAATLTDERVEIEVTGLAGRSSVLVRATAQSRDGKQWESRVRFDVSDAATLSVADRAPVAEASDDAGATVCDAEIVAPESEAFLLDPEVVDLYQGEFTTKIHHFTDTFR